MNIRDLGPYRVERSEDYGGPEDMGYGKMIRVRGSKSQPPIFTVPSHLYKYSETKLGLYLNDRKNLWRSLAKLLNEDIDISGQEIILVFPIERFPEVARVVPFVKKRGLSGNPELAKKVGRGTQFGKNDRHKMKQNVPKTLMKESSGNITPSESLDRYFSEFLKSNDIAEEDVVSAVNLAKKVMRRKRSIVNDRGSIKGRSYHNPG
ncbi:MAG: hypothetical protein QXU18_14855 [Thermoplasmatales archaeon]